MEENEEDKNRSLTFQFIAAIGSLATVGSFFYLFRRYIGFEENIIMF